MNSLANTFTYLDPQHLLAAVWQSEMEYLNQREKR